MEDAGGCGTVKCRMQCLQFPVDLFDRFVFFSAGAVRFDDTVMVGPRLRVGNARRPVGEIGEHRGAVRQGSECFPTHLALGQPSVIPVLHEQNDLHPRDLYPRRFGADNLQVVVVVTAVICGKQFIFPVVACAAFR